MTVKTRAKRKVKVSSGDRSFLPNLVKGDWLDVLDCEGVWNVARVLSVPAYGKVEVAYDGWPKRYNEIVRVDSDRVAPYHTFTRVARCWVKYLNWPTWPSLAAIRSPGTEEGIENLKKEKRLLVDFCDKLNFSKRSRNWQMKSKVKAFEHFYDSSRAKTNGDDFEQALEIVLLAKDPLSDVTSSKSSWELPQFSSGTLPSEYKNSTTVSVDKMRGAMGNEQWYKKFANSKLRHQNVHGYKSIGDDEVNIEEETKADDSASDASGIPTTPELLTGTKKRVLLKPRKDKRFRKVPTAGRKASTAKDASSSDSSSEDQHVTTRAQKRRRLRTRSREAESKTRTRVMARHSKSRGRMEGCQGSGRYLNLGMDSKAIEHQDERKKSVAETNNSSPATASSSKVAAIDRHIAKVQKVLQKLQHGKQKALAEASRPSMAPIQGGLSDEEKLPCEEGNAEQNQLDGRVDGDKSRSKRIQAQAKEPQSESEGSMSSDEESDEEKSACGSSALSDEEESEDNEKENLKSVAVCSLPHKSSDDPGEFGENHRSCWMM